MIRWVMGRLTLVQSLASVKARGPNLQKMIPFGRGEMGGFGEAGFVSFRITSKYSANQQIITFYK
jgi:hypothetical protein